MSNWSYNPGIIVLWLAATAMIIFWLTLPSKDLELIKAAVHNNTNAIYGLFRKGASINARVKSTGRTALMNAAEKGHWESVDTLLKLGAERDLKDGSGKTALDYAVENNRTNIIELLK